MKQIGTTVKGSYLVEMTRDEYSALNKLALAIEGKTLWEMSSYITQAPIGCELEIVLGNLTAWAAIRSLSTEFKVALETFDRIFEEPLGKNLKE